MANEKPNPAETRSGSQQCHLIIKIDDINVDPSNVQYLVIREWMYDDVRVPRIELIITDDGLFTDYSLPYRGKKIFVQLSRDKFEKYETASGSYVDSTFVIMDFEFVKELGSASGNNSSITITGILDIPKWFEILPDEQFPDSTSSDVLASVCSDLGVSLNDSSDVSDNMSWLRINQTPGQFIQHVVSRAKTTVDDDVSLFWIDIYGNAYYTNISSLNQGIVHDTKYHIKYATEIQVDSLIKMGEVDGHDENEMLTSLWYTSLNFRNNQGANFVIKGGTTNEYKLDLNQGTYYFGNGNESSNASPVATSEVVTYNQYENLLATDLNPNTDFPGVDNNLYSGIVLTGQTDNLWDLGYLSNPYSRSSAISALYNNSVIIEVSPNTPSMIGDSVNLVVHSNISNDDNSYENSTLSGTYLITGSMYIFIDGFFKKMLTVNRTGFNTQDIGE